MVAYNGLPIITELGRDACRTVTLYVEQFAVEGDCKQHRLARKAVCAVLFITFSS